MDSESMRVVGDRTPFLFLLAAAAIGAFFGFLVYRQAAAPFVRERVKDPVVVNLQDLAAHNGLKLQAPSGANAVDYVQTKTFTIDGDTRPVIFMHPTSSASYFRRLPDELRLEFAMGIDPAAWDQAGDGVEFQVEVRDGDQRAVVFDAFIDPKKNNSDRRWVDASVDLSRFAYREIDLVMRTFPGASSEFDWAGWAAPRLVYVNP